MMNLFYSILMILIGLFLFISARKESNFFIYHMIVYRSKFLWKEKVYIIHQVSGAIIVILGVFFTIQSIR